MEIGSTWSRNCDVSYAYCMLKVQKIDMNFPIDHKADWNHTLIPKNDLQEEVNQNAQGAGRIVDLPKKYMDTNSQ